MHTFIGSWKIGQLGVGDHRFTKYPTVSRSSHEFQMTCTHTHCNKIKKFRSRLQKKT